MTRLIPWYPHSLNDIHDHTTQPAAPSRIPKSSAFFIDADTWPAWQQQLVFYALTRTGITNLAFHPDSKQPSLPYPTVTGVTMPITLNTTGSLKLNPEHIASLHIQLSLDRPGENNTNVIHLDTNLLFQDADDDSGVTGIANTPHILFPHHDPPTAEALAHVLLDSYFLYDSDYEDYASQRFDAVRDTFALAATVLQNYLPDDPTYPDTLNSLISENLQWTRQLPHNLDIQSRQGHCVVNLPASDPTHKDW